VSTVTWSAPPGPRPTTTMRPVIAGATAGQPVVLVRTVCVGALSVGTDSVGATPSGVTTPAAGSNVPNRGSTVMSAASAAFVTNPAWSAIAPTTGRSARKATSVSTVEADKSST